MVFVNGIINCNPIQIQDLNTRKTTATKNLRPLRSALTERPLQGVIATPEYFPVERTIGTNGFSLRVISSGRKLANRRNFPVRFAHCNKFREWKPAIS